jgi:plastocyanin
MKTTTLFVISAFMLLSGLNAQTGHKVTESGFAYSPADLSIATGDTVTFEGTASHPIQEVSEETWTNNGITPLAGGFAFESGSGTVVFPNTGVHYYVCTVHVALGMKGKITVGSPTALNLTELKGTSLYPVPLTGNTLTMNMNKPVQELSVRVYDMAGNTWITETGAAPDGSYRLQCPDLAKGLYFLQLKSGDSETVLKFTKD